MTLMQAARMDADCYTEMHRGSSELHRDESFWEQQNVKAGMVVKQAAFEGKDEWGAAWFKQDVN